VAHNTPYMILFPYLFHANRDFHSVPTRRSSDLFARFRNPEIQNGGNNFNRFRKYSAFGDFSSAVIFRGFARLSEFFRRNHQVRRDRKSTRLNSSHVSISYAVFCLKTKKRSTKMI